MANMPVEKKGGTPWILWLVALIALAGIIWLLVEMIDTDSSSEELVVTEPGVEEPRRPQGGAGEEAAVITDVESLIGVQNPEQLVGRPVQLTGMSASAVTGDSTFWMSPTAGDGEARVFAVLRNLREWEEGPGTGADGVFHVDKGDDLAVYGQIARVEPGDPDAWKVTGAERAEMTANQVYVRVNRIEFEDGNFAYLPGEGDDGSIARDGSMPEGTARSGEGARGVGEAPGESEDDLAQNDAY